MFHSDANVRCTLNELNGALTIGDCDCTFGNYERYRVPVTMTSDRGTVLDVSNLFISNTMESPVLGDEYEFELLNRPASGTFHEWMQDSSNDMLCMGGELALMTHFMNDAEFDSDKLPVITLENANIHKCMGSWDRNINWSIREVIDAESGNVNYKLKNVGKYRSDSYACYSNSYYVLRPSEDPMVTPSLKYTAENKWHVPMFVIKGYTWDMSKIADDKKMQYDMGDSEYILEIHKGDMLFK